MTDRLHRMAHRRSSTPTGSPGESGVALVLAMAFVFVVITVVFALMTFSDATSRSLGAYRRERTLRYNADAAIQAGIAEVKADTTNTLGTCYPSSSCPAPPPDRCALQVPIQELGTFTMASGSYLVVSCPATNSSSGLVDPTADGEPSPRDVTFAVTCGFAAAPAGGGLPSCGSGGTPITVLRARIRFDVDYSYTCAVSCTPTNAATARARVPKVVWWNEYYN